MAQEDPIDEQTEHVLGLVPDPGVPVRISEWLADQERLASRLSEATGENWRVEVAQQTLPLDSEHHLQLFDLAKETRSRQGWDLVVLVSDLPRRAEGLPLLADYGTDAGVGLLSVPALGAVGPRRRALQVLSDLVAQHLWPRVTSRQRSGPAQRGPFGHIVSTTEGIDEHIALLGARGRLRLLAGMVRSNRPWRLLPSLSQAMAGAAGGAAFGVFYSNIWILADQSSVLRLLLVNVLVVLSMVGWLIANHNLWERSSDVGSREQMVIANTSTVATITVAVVSVYVLLFVVTLVASLVVIPGAEMERNLEHAASFGDYATTAWMAASIGTIAGAVGSGMADETAVKEAAYSHREYERRKRLHRQEEQESGA